MKIFICQATNLGDRVLRTIPPLIAHIATPLFLAPVLACRLAGPTLSPAHKIAYDSDRGLARGIFAIKPDGTAPVVLAKARFLGTEEEPHWSPDGARIAFVSEAEIEGGYFDQVFVINLDGAQPTRLTPSRGYDGNPSWRP